MASVNAGLAVEAATLTVVELVAEWVVLRELVRELVGSTLPDVV